MPYIVLLGSGYHLKVLENQIINSKLFKILGYANHSIANKKLRINSKYLGKFEDLKKIRKKFFGLLCVGQGNIREKMLNEIKKKKLKLNWAKFISPQARILHNVKIGNGSVVLSGAIINSNTKIKKHCLINSGAIIEHDNTFENFSTASPGVVTGGNVKVGKKTFLGLGSIIKNKINIDNNVVIGCGSNVVSNCKENYIYFGNPAKKIRKLKKREIFL